VPRSRYECALDTALNCSTGLIEVSHDPALIIRKVYPEWKTCIRRILKLIVNRFTEPMKNL
ncbi:hypothetical protein ACV35N_36410, partial [Pseudomonas aeruginosa]